MAHEQLASTTIKTGGLREKEAASYLGMSPDYLRAARAGRCVGPVYVKLGRSVRYLLPDLDQFLKSRRVTSRRGKVA